MQRRKPLIVTGRLVLIALLYPAFWLMNQFPALPVVLGLIVLLMFFYTMGSAPAYALLPENFPKHVRAGSGQRLRGRGIRVRWHGATGGGMAHQGHGQHNGIGLVHDHVRHHFALRDYEARGNRRSRTGLSAADGHPPPAHGGARAS
jgi:hypothetical protein